MIKLSMFNKMENFNKFTKLNKDFGKLDDKLIIQHFHHIHICNLAYTIYYSNFSTFKIHIILVVSNHTRIWNVHAEIQKESK